MAAQYGAATADPHAGLRKVFVGCLPSNVSEEELAVLFGTFGTVLEVVMLPRRGTSPDCCAFVRYTDHAAAEAALSLNNTLAFGGDEHPIVVRYAATAHEKHARRQKLKPGPEEITKGTARVMTSSQLRQQQPSLQISPDAPVRLRVTVENSSSEGYDISAIRDGEGGEQTMTLTIPIRLSTKGGTQTVHVAPNVAEAVRVGSSSGALAMSDESAAVLKMQRLASELSNGDNHPALNSVDRSYGDAVTQLSGSHADHDGFKLHKQSYGPPGCNLFVFYLPNWFQEVHLEQLFSPFGTIKSVRLFVDKYTGLSKGFGFVSYVSPESAQKAIIHTNGLRIGRHRLKVELKARDPFRTTRVPNQSGGGPAKSSSSSSLPQSDLRGEDESALHVLEELLEQAFNAGVAAALSKEDSELANLMMKSVSGMTS